MAMCQQRRLAIAVAMGVLLAKAAAFADAPVTVEMLTTLRAQERNTPGTVAFGLNPDGSPYATETCGTTAMDATIALRRTYDVPYCVEYGPSNPEYRFPFAIEPNQRLVDALDVLKENSGGYAQWRLLHGRIILTYGQPTEAGEVFIMDRPVKVDFQARTWREAIVQIESAYNAQYSDLPLIMDALCPDHDDQIPILHGQKATLAYPSDSTLREAVLSILDASGQPWAEYSLWIGTGGRDHRYASVTITLPDSRDAFEKEGDYARYRARTDAKKERLDQYFADAQRRRDEAAKASGGAP